MADTYAGEGLSQADKVLEKYQKGRDRAHQEFKQKAEHQKITESMIQDSMLRDLTMEAKAGELYKKLPAAGRRVTKEEGQATLNQMIEQIKTQDPAFVEELKNIPTRDQQLQKIREKFDVLRKSLDVSRPQATDRQYAQDKIGFDQMRGPASAPDTQLPPKMIGGSDVPYYPEEAVQPVGEQYGPPAPGQEGPGYIESIPGAAYDAAAQMGEGISAGAQEFASDVGAGVDKVAGWLRPEAPRADLIGSRELMSYQPPRGREEYEERYPYDMTETEVTLEKAQIAADLGLRKIILNQEGKKAISQLENRMQQKRDMEQFEEKALDALLGGAVKIKTAGIAAKASSKGSGSAEAGRQYKADQRIVDDFQKVAGSDLRFKFDYKFGGKGLSKNKDWLSTAKLNWNQLRTDKGRREFKAAFSEFLPVGFFSGATNASKSDSAMSTYGTNILGKLKSQRPNKQQASKALDKVKPKISDKEYKQIKSWIEKNL